MSTRPGETFVTGIWENTERAYEGTVRFIPDEFRETIQRKADLFERLVVLLREPVQSEGLSEVDLRRWLPEVQAALAQPMRLWAALLFQQKGRFRHETPRTIATAH